MQSLRKQATKIIRNSNNSHSFVYFIDGRIRTFSTHIDDINSQIAALFGSLNAVSVLSFPAKVMLSMALAMGPMSAAFALDPGALPTGYTSVSGNVQFNQTPGVLNVNTAATKSIVNYDTFNIGSNARVNFNLPTSSSSILNRVVGGNTSEIYGTMSSNGRVFLVNPAGIFFGNGANVTVNGIVASTLGISDQKFLAGQYEFTKGAGTASGHIEVAPGANITVLNGGTASFLASSFVNNGNITANGGAIQIGVGDRITLGDDLIGITVNEALSESLNHAALINNGTLTAAQVKLIASTVKQDVLDVIVNNSGRISANKVVDGAGGTVELIAENGIVNNSGVINASGIQGGQITLQGEAAQNSGQLLASGSLGQGGSVSVLGNQSVGLTDNAFINASGQTGGGSVFIGGDYMGGNPLIRNALYTYVGQNVAIRADALNSGNGGKVIVWGNEATGFYGNISAQGGLLSGNGGFVETSGKNYLDMQGSVNANALSANGSAGSWLLDPRDVVIDNSDNSVAYTYNLFTNTWTVSPTSILFAVSQIKVGSINNALDAGTNVTIHTGNYGTQAGDITVNGLIHKSSASTSTLSLLAADDIILSNSGSIKATGSAQLNVVLKSDYDIGAFDPSNGNGSVQLNGSIITNNGSVDISGVSTTLTSTLNAGTGNVTINASGGDITQSAGALSANNLSITTDNGNIKETGGSISANAITLNATGGNIALTGGTIAGNSLNATTNSAGKTITISDSDFSNVTLKTNNGNITDTDRDGVSVNVNAGTGTASINTTVAGVSSNNGATESNLTLTGNNQAQTLNLTAKAGNINQAAGSKVVGTTLNATTNGVGSTIALTNVDFGNVDLNTKFGDITYTDSDGVSAHFDTGNATGNTTNITAGNGANLNGGAEVSGLQITGVNQTGTANLTAKAGSVSQASGSINAVTTNLTAENGGVSQSGGSISSTTVNLNATNGNITHSNGSITATTANLTAVNGGISQTGGSVSAGTVNLTTTGGAISETGGTLSGTNLAATTNTAGNGIIINDADFGNATLKANNGNIVYNDRDGVSVNVNAGTGNATISTSVAGIVSNNGVAEANLILSGDNKAQAMNLTANTGNINQSGGTVVGNTLNATTNGVGNTITINNADFSSADLKTNFGNINYTDTDGIAVHFDVGTSAANIANITAGNGANLNGGLEANGIQLTGGSQAGLVNLIAQTGNFVQNNGALNSNTSNLIAQNGSIIQSGGLLSSVNLNLNATNGDINQSNGTMNAAILNLQTTNGSILKSGGAMLANTIGLTATNGFINQTGGSISGGDVNLTTTGGNISQTGGTMTGNNLNVHTESAPGQAINISNADFTNATLKTNNANITYSDSDGVTVNVNAGTTGNASITAGTDSLASNGVVENGLQLTGANQANTLGLLANHGNISQAAGSSVIGTTLNATTNGAGNTIAITNADFSNVDLKTNLGDITYTDTDGVSAHFDTGNATGNTTNITAGNGANLNGGAEASGLQITGVNQTGTANLTAKAGSVSQASGSINAVTTNLTAENGGVSQSGGSITSTTVNLNATNGNITHSNGSITATTANLTAVNGGISQTGGSVSAGTVNLTTTGGAISETGGTLSGTNLAATTNTAGNGITINDADFGNATLKANNGNIVYNDRDGVSVNVNAGTGNASVSTNVAGVVSNNAVIESNLVLTGDNKAQTLNVTANAGNISQSAGSTVAGMNLNATTNGAGNTVTLTDADFGNATLNTNNGNVTYNDRDGVSVNVNAGTGNATINTSVAGIVSNNAVAESDLTLTGANKAQTLNLTANVGNINQAAGSTLIGTTLNAETKELGRTINITDADFNNANLKSKDGNISYQDADAIIASIQVGIGTATVINKAAGLLSNNASDNLGGITLTGINSGVSVNLTANEGSIAQTANSTIQGATLNAENKQAGKSITLTDTDFSFTNLKTNNGNITLNDRDGLMGVNVQAGTGNANISTEVSSAHSVNFTEGPGLVMTGDNHANTLNLTTNVGDITQTAGSTLSGNALNVKTGSGEVILTNDSANQFNQFSASSKQGNVNYRDVDGINLTSVNLNTDNNSTLGNFSIQTNGAGNITQTGSINGVNNLTVITDTGNATLTNAFNDAQNLTISSNQGNVSFRDLNNINVNSANLDADGNEVRGNLSLQTSLFCNITQTGNITGVETLKLRTDLGNANLALDNNVHNLDTGSNVGSTTFTNTGSFNLTGANMNMNNLLWKGDLNLTAQTGQITQTAAINASELKITGNANLTNNQNNVDVLSAFGNGVTVSFTDKNGFNLAQSNVGNGVLNLGTVTGEINQTAYFPILSSILQNRNISNNGGVTAGALNLNLGSGANAYLTNSQNVIGNFSLLGSLNCVKLVNSINLNLSGANDSTGILDTTVLNGQNLTQSAGLSLGGLKVTMQDGGQFNLNDATNNVQALSVNATGANTQNSQGSFTNNGSLTLAASDLNDGDLSLTLLNGGSLTQGNYDCASGACGLAAGGLHSDEFKVNLLDGGDATLSNSGNLVNSFSANAWGSNTINSQVQFTNAKDLNLASSFLNQGDLSLTLLNGANLNQDNLYNSGGIFFPEFMFGNSLFNFNPFGGNSISRNILSNGGVFANEFSVNLLGGGSASLNTQFNSVRVFSGNASENSINSTIRFNNFGNLNLAHSDVGQGKLYVVTQGNLDNADLSENNRNITTNSSTLHGDVINLEAAGGGNLDVYNNITATSEIRLTTSRPSGESGFPGLQLLNLELPGLPGFTIPTGGINIHAGANVEARTGSVYFNTDHLTIDGQVQGQLVQIWPWSLSLSMGIAGGSGNMQLSQGLVNHINNDPELGLNTLMFGHQNYTGTISLGSLNLSNHRLTDVAFNAPRVFDATPTNDSSYNVIMAKNRNVFFTAGADTVANWASAPGGTNYGTNNSLFADLDVAVSGSGLIHVRLLDYTGVGNGFSILTGGGNSAFINAMDQDNSGSLKNYGSSLSARASSLIINEIKGTSINLPGNPVDNTPTSYGSTNPVQVIPNQSF